MSNSYNIPGEVVKTSHLPDDVPTHLIGVVIGNSPKTVKYPVTSLAAQITALMIDVVKTSQVYNNPSWIGSLAWSKITGVPSFSTSLSSLSDVQLGTLTPGQALVYNGTKWENQNALSIDPNEGLELVGSVLGTIYNSTIADGVNSVAVGGATAQPASFWKSKTLVQTLDTILFPTLLASIQTAKSVNLAVDGSSGIVEIGTSVSRTLTATFVRGTILNGDGTTGPNLVGTATQYSFSGTGISTTNQAGSTLAINVAVVNGTNNWAVTVTHAIGTGAYFDNKGNAGTNLDASRVAGTTTDSTSAPTITGRYRQFFGPTTTTPTTSAEVRAFGSNFTDTNSFNSGTFTQTKFVIAIPATRNLVSVITSSLENITSNFVLATFNVNDAGGTAVSYKVYTFTSVTPLGLTATITLSGT